MKIRFSDHAEADLRDLFVHLYESALGFGYDHRSAISRSRSRIQSIRKLTARIAEVPGVGTARGGVRHVTLDRAIYWFRVTDDAVEILGIFTAGQDHMGRMMARLTRT